jgi:hypothetical protein
MTHEANAISDRRELTIPVELINRNWNVTFVDGPKIATVNTANPMFILIAKH